MLIKTKIWEQCPHTLAGKARENDKSTLFLPMCRGLFGKVHFLETLENLEIPEIPQGVENKGERDQFLKILTIFEIWEILEIPFVMTPFSGPDIRAARLQNKIASEKCLNQHENWYEKWKKGFEKATQNVSKIFKRLSCPLKNVSPALLQNFFSPPNLHNKIYSFTSTICRGGHMNLFGRASTEWKSAVPKRGRSGRGQTQTHAKERKWTQKSANASLQKKRNRAFPRKNCNNQVWNNAQFWKDPPVQKKIRRANSLRRPNSLRRKQNAIRRGFRRACFLGKIGSKLLQIGKTTAVAKSYGFRLCSIFSTDRSFWVVPGLGTPKKGCRRF